MKKIFLSMLAVLAVIGAAAQQTFRNPVINADAPDVSVCKVADTYYMISTTMHLMPGAPIMKSKDMVNWEVISYVFDRIDDGDRYNLIDGQTVYGQGQWASSLRYHMGKFYVWFTANGAPGKGFVFEADQAEGPWHLVARPPHMHDASLFFDEDGKRYLFTGTGNCTVVELDENFQPMEGGIKTKVVDGATDPEENGALLEGSSVFKHNGKYYLCMISMKWGVDGRVRREVCYRADKITGPYEKKVILETPFESYGGVGQGCLVGDDQSDQNWWALIFQDRGGIGRVPCTLPVTWVDGWPMVGEFTGEINAAIKDSPGDNPTGDIHLDKRAYRTPSDYTKMHPSVLGFIGSDEFDLQPVDPNGGYHARNGMSLYWQWNHNPIDEAWSLTERPGFMRLKTARVVDNLQVAPNTLTQRMSGPMCSGAVKIDVSAMKDGDVCGLAAFNGDSGVLRVVKKGGKYVLQLVEEKGVFVRPRNVDHVDVDVIAEEKLNFGKSKVQSPKSGAESGAQNGKFIYLKVNGDFNPGRDMASFAYSLDGEDWKTIGREIPMRFDYTRHFMGTKFAIFNYATKSTGGQVDVDWFHFTEGAEPVRPSKLLTENDFGAYVMVYHKDCDHSLHMAISRDGYNWKALSDDRPVISGDTIAVQHGIRDPHIFRGPDGGFYLAMTDLHLFSQKKYADDPRYSKLSVYRDTEWERPGSYGWGNNRGLVLMKSFDLIHWTRTNVDFSSFTCPTGISDRFGNALPWSEVGCVWAPETVYDYEAGHIMIHFTSRMQNGTPMIFYAYVNDDFTQLISEPKPLFMAPLNGNGVPSYGIIDSDICRAGDTYHLFYVSHQGSATVKHATSKCITGPYVMDENYNDGEKQGHEAPNCWKLIGKDQWVVMFDNYGRQPHNFGFVRTEDFQNFDMIGYFGDETSPMQRANFAEQKHGAVAPITLAEAAALEAYFK